MVACSLCISFALAVASIVLSANYILHTRHDINAASVRAHDFEHREAESNDVFLD